MNKASKPVIYRIVKTAVITAYLAETNVVIHCLLVLVHASVAEVKRRLCLVW